MLRHVEPDVSDEEPLLGYDPVEEEETSSSLQSSPYNNYSKRKAAPDKRPSYRSGSRSIVFRHHDLLVKVREGDDEEENGEKRAVSTVSEYGPCGLKACNSSFWRVISIITRCIYAYFFFNWTIIFCSLSLCTTVSLVYDAWLADTSLGQASIVMAMLPTLNLLWIVMSFVWHILCWGVWNDFFDLEAALQGLRSQTRHQFIRNFLTYGVAILINVPVAFSFVVFCYQIHRPAAEWIWQSQFWLSFVCNILLASLFFAGSYYGQDHTPVPAPPPPSSPNWLCRCFYPIWYFVHSYLTSDAFRAMRVYMRSAFVDGGAFSQKNTSFGRRANEYIPEPVDLEESPPERYKALGIKGKYSKRWPTPWFMGFYLKIWANTLCGVSMDSDQSRCFYVLVHLPWTLLLFTTIAILAYISWSIKAYVLFAFVTGYFFLLPLFYAALRRALMNVNSGRLVLDIILIVVMLSGFFLSLAVSSMYLGPSIIAIVLLANLATLMAHFPAIRDREYPPPKDHREGLAFHTKAMTHTIISMARGWAFVSILFVLALVLAMRTVPNKTGGSYTPKARSPHHPINNGTSSLSTGLQEGSDGGKQPYPFCGASYAGLSVLELAHISNAAYMEIDEAKEYIDEYIPHKDFQITLLDLAKEYGVAYGPITYQLKDTMSKSLVFAIRGTNEVFDLYQDLDVWMEAMVIQGASYIFPLYGSPVFQPFMEKFVGTPNHLVQAVSSLKDVLLNRQGAGIDTGSRQRYYYNLLYDYLVNHVLTDPALAHSDMVLTGHSLGGGVAQIVAARLQSLAVTFSAPGVVLSRRKFGITLDDIDEYLVNIQPQGDLVPLLDIQGVKAQQIRCKSDALSYHCHSVLNTIDEVTDGCLSPSASVSAADVVSKAKHRGGGGGR